jgi:branched-subunit amino acid ABC-type transport system permease component
MAVLLGVNVDRTISITFVMGAALAAVAGVCGGGFPRRIRTLAAGGGGVSGLS